MRKYWVTFTNSVATMLTYRVNLLWKLGGHLFSLAVLYFLWSTILKSGFGAAVYTQKSLLSYYVAITFVGLFIQYDYHLIADDIRLGTLTTHLVRPYNYYFEVFVEGLADKVLILLIFTPVLITLVKLETLGLLVVTIFLAMVTRFLIIMTIGGLAFWFNRVHGFNAAIFTVGGLFSGELIPADLLPQQLQMIANFLPFKYLSFVPAKYLAGNFANQNILINFLMQLFWIGVWLLIVKIIWQKGLVRYESAGR
jgi:ABC-2 type transport system permease protein